MDLRLCCVAELNTAADGSPASQSLTLHPASETVAAEAPDCACPLKIERLARLQSGCTMQSIYDSATGCLCVQPLKTASSLREWLQWQLSLPDDLLMSYASTSPKHEHANFAEGEAELCPCLFTGDNMLGEHCYASISFNHRRCSPCNNTCLAEWDLLGNLLAAHDQWQGPVSSLENAVYCMLMCRTAGSHALDP